MISMKLGSVAAVAGCAIVLAGCTSSVTTEPEPAVETGSSGYVGATSTMSANGVSYEYPAAWKLSEVTADAQTGNQLWNQNLAVTASDFASISAYGLNEPITGANLGQAQDEFAVTLDQLAAQANGAVTVPLTPEGTAGLPGLTGELAVETPDGVPVDSTIWVFFDGATEYFLNCQYTPAEQTQILAGCGLMRDTFKITG